MIVIPDITLQLLMQNIVEASHCLSDENGDAHPLTTINGSQLRLAAISAIQIAVGDVAWPYDRKIVRKHRRADFGIFREE